MRRFVRLFFVIALSAGLFGCAGMFDPGPPMAHVILPNRLQVAEKSERMPVQVLVAPPIADATIGTDRIMALMNGYEVRALDAAKWVAPVPWLVRRLITDSLEASRRLQAVGWEESGLDAKVRLSTDIRRFYLRYDSPDAPPTVELLFIFSLTDMDSGKLLSRKSVAVEQPCVENTVQEFVAAFSTGMAKVLDRVGEWAHATLERQITESALAR